MMQTVEMNILVVFSEVANVLFINYADLVLRIKVLNMHCHCYGGYINKVKNTRVFCIEGGWIG